MTGYKIGYINGNLSSMAGCNVMNCCISTCARARMECLAMPWQYELCYSFKIRLITHIQCTYINITWGLNPQLEIQREQKKLPESKIYGGGTEIIKNCKLVS